MKLIVFPYVPPVDWRVTVLWKAGGYHTEWVKAESEEEAKVIGKRIKEVLEAAIKECDRLAKNKSKDKGIFDE